MSTSTYSEMVSGPRWIDIEGYMELFAKKRGLKLTIDRVSKVLLRKNVYFTISGEDQAILDWCDDCIAQFG